jgi:superfamily II DNA or RNA helicase
MATGLGKTRTTVALCKALLDTGLARRILFVVDRRLLAEQARDDGFSLISPTYTSGWITTSNYRGFKHKDIHVSVIDTLEIIFSGIPSTYYDLLIVDECHRSINVSRRVIFDHFLCPRIGLTATPRIAIPKDPKKVTDDDLAILDTYRLFGCEVGEPTYEFDLGRGIEEGFLAPYKVDEIKTHLTQIAEQEGVEFDYVLDPDERKKIELDKTKKLKLEQLNRKYLTENTAKRIAEEIRKRTEYGEKMILFGVSQPHCSMLANALNKAFNDEGKYPRYAEPIISDNAELNRTLKGWFKKPYQKPYIAVSVDIMSTGVDIPCVRYIGFATLTRSVGKYIQMLGRGTRLDPKTGKFSFQILDFVGLCKRMGDNGKGTEKKNKKVVTGTGGGGGGEGGEPEGYFIVDNPDPEHQIQRVKVHEGVRVVENTPIEEAKRIFEAAVSNPDNPAIVSLKQKLYERADYEPTAEDVEAVEDWVSKPEIWLDEGNLQRIYDYPAGSVWDFFLHVLGKRRIPTPLQRVQTGYENYIRSAEFTDAQVHVLELIKDVFVSTLSEHGTVDAQSIFQNPIYESIIGTYDEVNGAFDGKIGEVIKTMSDNFKLARAA